MRPVLHSTTSILRWRAGMLALGLLAGLPAVPAGFVYEGHLL